MKVRFSAGTYVRVTSGAILGVTATDGVFGPLNGDYDATDDLLFYAVPAPEVKNTLTTLGENITDLGVKAVRKATMTAVTLLGMFYREQAAQAIAGPRLRARAGLPLATDAPTITSASGDPSSDADAATYSVLPFGVEAGSELPATNKTRNKFVRGFSKMLPLIGWGNALRAASRCVGFNTNGNQDRAPNGFGIDRALCVTDLMLHGDVLFLRGQGGADHDFELYVNGSLVTAAPGTGVTLQGGRQYRPANGWVKLKFPSVAQRRIQIVSGNNLLFGEYRTRATATLTPAIKRPLTWVHFGDSFSQYSGATYPQLGCTSWLHSMFGFECDFVDVSVGSTSVADPVNTSVDDTPTTGNKPQWRLQWRLSAKAYSPDIITMLIGHNDAAGPAFRTELAALLDELRADCPGALIILVGCNSSTAKNVGNGDLNIEADIATVCAGRPGVQFCPLQGGTEGRLLRGTSGNAGSPAGQGNVDVLVSGDNVHPTDTGHEVFGRAMARSIVEALHTI
jgi:lysophospholipase L1-like esterase